MYVYLRSEPNLWTAGHYDPADKWIPESDHGSKESAAARCHYLNGGTGPELSVSCKDGGPAFPGYALDDNGDETVTLTKLHPGMTLRDYFAGQALAGLLAAPDVVPEHGEKQAEFINGLAGAAYGYADAMIAARGK